MADGISAQARSELLGALRQRYREATKQEKSRILDEFVAVAKCHRKHAVRLLGRSGDESAARPASNGRRIYDTAVREALVVAWEASDRICGKRLKAILPRLVEAMERHGHLDLDLHVRERVLSISAATIDRLLVPVRSRAGSRRKRRGRKKIKARVPVRTFGDWDEPLPGFLEIDFVAHCGGTISGAFIHSLVATDVCSGWTEAIPLLAREQSLVVEGVKAIGRQLPVAIRGIDSDNDGAFINETLVNYCARRDIEFTRSRPYRKNDQAWIEQKNGAVVRRFVGYDRYSGPIAGQVLAHLYGAVRLYVNHFQPSFKLVEKTRCGAKVTKRYDKPATPCDRLLGHDAVSVEIKEALREQRAKLDPVALLHAIREAQSALAALVSPGIQTAPNRESLEQFLSQLPNLWRLGEVRPTHSPRPKRPRTWRTRKDPFDGVWSDVLLWLQQDPDAPAKALFERLKSLYPGQFTDGQLRTLQRRVREWRAIMAKELVYASLEENEPWIVAAIGID
jgi:Integrase core domain